MTVREFIFVQNPISGSDDAHALRELIEDRLHAAGERFRFLAVDGLDTIPPEEAVGHPVIIVAVGGDGTVNAAARVALRLHLPFAIIAAGTFNFVARAHQIPEQIEPAIELLLNGKTHATQVGSVNGRPFLVNASIGLYAKLLQEREQIKQTIGRSRAVAALAAVFTALQPYRELDIELRDGENTMRRRAATFFVGNNQLQLQIGSRAETLMLICPPRTHNVCCNTDWRQQSGQLIAECHAQ